MLPERDLVFLSYRHEDERWLKAIRNALEPYVLADKLLAWSDRDIRVASRWHNQIQEALSRTRVGVVLISQQLFGSDYIRRQELPRLVEDADRDLIELVCVPIETADPELLSDHKLTPYQFTHSPDTPLNKRRPAQRQEAVVKVAMCIKEAYRRRGAEPRVDQASGDTVRRAESLALLGVDATPRPSTVRIRAVLHSVPPLDRRRYVPRKEALAQLKQLLLQGTSLTTGVTSPRRAGSVGLHGMGGMGKTVLAQAACEDEDVRCAFPDGIFWLTLGQQPALLETQNRLLQTLNPEVPPGESVSQAQERLVKQFSGKRALLVIDDLWNATHFWPFDVASGQSRVLITTRDASLLTLLGATEHQLTRLEPDQAVELLAQWARTEASVLPLEGRQIVELCGRLPLALALAGAQIADGVSWQTLVEQLKRGKLEFLDHEFGSVYKSLGLSVDTLEDMERARYLELAVFPEDARIPMEVVARLWRHTGGLDASAVEKLLVRLSRKALLTLAREAGQKRVSFHDLQHDFVRLRAVDPVELNGLLLDAYRSTLALPLGATAWASLPVDEPYLWPRLAAHLAAAGRHDELRGLLLSLKWIEAKLAVASQVVAGHMHSEVSSLLRDYDQLPDVPEVDLVKQALRMSADVIRTRPEQVGFQIYGRLGTSGLKAITQLCAEVQTEGDRLPLMLLRPSLNPPDSVSLTLPSHEDSVTGVALLADDRRALSWSDDSTLKLWDLEQGELLHSLTGHEAWVTGAALLADGRRVLSWSVDRCLKLWDLEQGKLLHSLTGHEAWITGAVLLADSRQALSWSIDGSLRLWDLKLGTLLHSLAGHEKKVNGAALLADGQRALSWSQDRSLKLWDLAHGGLLCNLTGHGARVTGAALLADGRRALSWSLDCSLKLWDLEQGELLCSLTGHEAWITGASLLPDGRRALSWSVDGSIKLWDLEQGELLYSLRGHEARVTGTLLLADCRRMLSWSDDGSLKLWDIEQGELLYSLVGHDGGVNGAALLADGCRVLSWSEDGSLKLWHLQAEKELGSYISDAALHEAVIGFYGTRIFAGDSVGQVHCLRLK